MARIAGFFCPLLLILAAVQAAAAGPVELVSRVDSSQISDTGAGPFAAPAPYDAFDPGSLPSLSADGRFLAFVSPSPNLVPGQRDANGDGQLPGWDVFLRDLVAGTTLLVSRSAGSETTAGNHGSGQSGMVLSADGRYVAFFSQATDLVPGQPVSPDGNTYLFVFDQMTKTMALAVTTNDDRGEFGNLAIGADGRYLTFTSTAADLVPGQSYDSHSHVFFYDRDARQLRLVDHKRGLPNLAGGGYAYSPGISADGRYVLYGSSSADLVSGQKPGDAIFLYDRTSGNSVAVGPASIGGRAMLSADGKYVAVEAATPYLYARETRVTTPVLGLATGFYGNSVEGISADGRYTLFKRGDGDNNFTLVVYDRIARVFTQAPRPSTLGNLVSSVSLSADGRYVLFLDPAPDVLSGQDDRNSYWDVFLFDRVTQKTSLVSHSTASPLNAANLPSLSPAISANGARVVFSSPATDLVAGVKDFNGGVDLFVYDVATGAITPATRRAPSLPSLSPDAASTARALSADGRWIAFESAATNLIAGQLDANGKTDVFLYDRTTRQTILVSHSAASVVTTGNGSSVQPSLSADGRYVSFLSSATDLPAGSTAQDGSDSVYVFDRIADSTQLVARTAGSGGADETRPVEQRISADGRWVAFTSYADDLIPGLHQSFYARNLFLWSRETGSLALISRSSLSTDLTTAHGESTSPALSAEGRYVAFRSGANDLVPGQTAEPPPSSVDTLPNIFLYDGVTGALALVSHGQASATAGTSVDSPPSISADGRFVVFASPEGDLAPGPHDANQSSYLYDRTLGTNQWITATARGDIPRISADGRTVAFVGDRPLLPGVEPDTFQLYLYDVAAKTLALATPSRRPGATGSSGDLSSNYAVSADGRYLAFVSDADDLVPGQIPPDPAVYQPRDDVYLFDRGTGTTVLVSRSKGSPLAATGQARLPLLSADGHRVAFTSDSSLADGDLNRQPDAYLFDLDAVATGGPVPVSPCPLFNGSLRSNLQKVLAAAGACGVPATATRVTVKVTARQGTGVGNLRLYPGNVAPPASPSGTLRFPRGQAAVSSFDLPLATNGAGTIAVLPFVRGGGTVQVTVEVDGYTP